MLCALGVQILAKVGDEPPLLPDIRQMIKKILPKSGHWALFQRICLYLVPPIHPMWVLFFLNLYICARLLLEFQVQ
jgi:hypothetical protein